MKTPQADRSLDDAGLDRLFDELVRDGWMLGMNAGVDPNLARMDAETGTYDGRYFAQLAQEAVEDAEAGRAPRIFDGPAPGCVALVAVRVPVLADPELPEEDHVAVARETSRRLSAGLRAEDAVGRIGPDTFALLLRGAPPHRLDDIAERCARMVDGKPIVAGDRIVPAKVVAACVRWRAGSAEQLVEAALASVGASETH